MAGQLEGLERHIGDSETAEDLVTAAQVGRLAAALDVAIRRLTRATRFRLHGTALFSRHS